MPIAARIHTGRWRNLRAPERTCGSPCQRDGAIDMGMIFKINTFFTSCPDASHYYGTVRDVNGKLIYQTLRCDTPAHCESKARAFLAKYYKGSALEIDAKIRDL